MRVGGRMQREAAGGGEAQGGVAIGLGRLQGIGLGEFVDLGVVQ